MELHPTPESWRIALFTAIGAVLVAGGGAVVLVGFGHSVTLVLTGVLIVLAAVATLLPALGALTATVDADTRGVTVRRLGRSSYYPWADVTEVRLLERRASVPDGTEYHWVVPSRSRHVVAVPCLALADGTLRELPALAAPASGARRAAASTHAEHLAHVRNQSSAGAGALVSRSA
jgi:PH (Pleckstrin Homology) domain-containing protein